MIKIMRSNYIVKDLLIWFLLLILLPITVFVIYYLAVSATNNDRGRASESSPAPAVFRAAALDHQQEMLMKKVLLSEALCNDGTPATYYVKQSPQRKRTWVILLEGGYFCYDNESCRARALNSANLTSSKAGKRFRRGRGLLASRPDENPYWHDVNLVTIPYCSSDLWIGNKKQNRRKTLEKSRLRSSTNGGGGEFHFMGQRILDDVLDDLIATRGMSEATAIVLIGQSAGGIGLLMNANRVRDRMRVHAPRARLTAVVDSSWLLDLPYAFLCAYSPTDECFMNKVFTNSLNYWNAQLPEACLIDDENKWECFLPYRILPSIKIPVFVVQSLFDETLLIERFNSKSYSQPGESLKFFTTLSEMGARMRATVLSSSQSSANHTYFLPACVQHSLLTRDDVAASLPSLARRLNCWALLDNCEDHGPATATMIDDCAWPTCKHATTTCPRLRHPDTNQVMTDVIEYFSYFGLVNYRQVADVLAMSETAVRRLGYDETMRIMMAKLNNVSLTE